MHWAEPNVNPMLALRNAICSDRWGEVWTQIEQEQQQQEHARRIFRQRQRRASALMSRVPGRSAEPDLHAQPTERDGGRPTGAAVISERRAAERERPVADHPWRKAWSIRRQREIASTA